MPRKRINMRMNVASRPGSTGTSPNMLHVTIREEYVRQADLINEKVTIDVHGDEMCIRRATPKDKDVSYFRTKPDELTGATFSGPDLLLFGTSWTDELRVNGGTLCFPHPRLIKRAPPKRTNKFMGGDRDVYT